MLRVFEGGVFDAGAQTLVNPVNCVGVMGAGLALEFKKRYPRMFEDYAEKCKAGRIAVGAVDYYREGEVVIANFPTKNHYRYDARLEWIEEGLKNFAATYEKAGVVSAAFPKLGAGGGNLDWAAVRALMERYLRPLPLDIALCLYEKPAAEQLGFGEVLS